MRRNTDWEPATVEELGGTPAWKQHTSSAVRIDADVLDQVERTKGAKSTSERVNQLLRYALANGA